MRTEVPICRRCCFCVPLRYGLLTWGYLLLVLLTILLIFEGLVFGIVLYFFDEGDIILFVSSFLIHTFQYVLNLLLIVAAHMKHTRLLKLYYTCGMVGAGLNALHLIAFFIYFVVNIWDLSISWDNLLIFTMSAIFIGLQLYVIALVRSEIVKLENGCRFEFRNIAAEAECGYYSPNEDSTAQKSPEVVQNSIQIDHNSPPTYTEDVTCNEISQTQEEALENDSPQNKEENEQSDIMKVKNKINSLNAHLSAVANKNISYNNVVNEE